MSVFSFDMVNKMGRGEVGHTFSVYAIGGLISVKL